MRFSTTIPAVILALASYAASQENHLVTVGDGGAVFSPTSLDNVAAGDTITFEFRAGNHTVTQSTFDAPCTPSGIDSDYMPLGDAPESFMQWSITVDDVSKPLWFYCKQGKHCVNGMVFAVNPTVEKSLELFAANAAASGGDAAGGGSASASAVPSGIASVSGSAITSSTPASSISAAEPSISPAGGASLGSTDGNGASGLLNVGGIWQSCFIATAMVMLGGML